MINVLVVEDNLYYSKNLINLLLSTNKNVKLYKIITDGKEAINTIKTENNNIDIVLLDLSLPNLDGLDILKYIEENNLIKYKESIIIISGKAELIAKVQNNTYLFSYIDKCSGFEIISQRFNELLKIKEQESCSLTSRIHEELQYLNYNFSYIGTIYLEEAIKLLLNYHDIESTKLEKTIYKKISKKYKKSVLSIKTNIINSTNLMYYDCESEKIYKYFGMSISEKPTPKRVILTVANKLKYY